MGVRYQAQARGAVAKHASKQARYTMECRVIADAAVRTTIDLERSTAMFGQLANPSGANDALSQVLYGLALRSVTLSLPPPLSFPFPLPFPFPPPPTPPPRGTPPSSPHTLMPPRHGWGCPPNPTLAITYLSAAASNSAAIESSALASGLKKGGTAKGELVLAIFELANCFRHGWGVGKDPVAARQYYETAANLGDTDAMNEVGWCYLEGFGGRKDKVSWFRGGRGGGLRLGLDGPTARGFRREGSRELTTGSTSIRRRNTTGSRSRAGVRRWGTLGLSSPHSSPPDFPLLHILFYAPPAFSYPQAQDVG